MKCIVKSNYSIKREYEVKTKSAMKAAKELGRCEAGEVVTIYTKTGKPISRVCWTPECGGKYYRATITEEETI